MSEFVTYEKFATIGELKEFVELLQANNIPYEIEDDVQLLDASFANPNHHRDYRIKVQSSDFEHVDELRNTLAISELDQINPDYYLFDFTDEELIDLISKQDEWSPFDFQLAQKILKERGKEVSSQKMDELRDSRIKELATAEKHSVSGIISGYMLTALGGVLSFVIYGYVSTLLVLIGLIIGGYIVSSKKTLPNGERIFTYGDSDRKQGKIILIIGVPMLIISVLMRLLGTLEFLSSL